MTKTPVAELAGPPTDDLDPAGGRGFADSAPAARPTPGRSVISLSSPSMSRDMSLLAWIFHGHDHSGWRRRSCPAWA
jgi:hypothetical protein